MTTPRTIVLTGATRGLGRALVERFAADGHVVAGCGTSTDGVAALRAAHGAPHRLEVVDVSDAAAVDAWAAGLAADGHVPELLVAHAGVINRLAPLWELTPDEIARVTAVNVNGVAFTARAFLPAMIARGRGVLVALSSGWGRGSSPEVAPYCASKHAVEGLVGALAQELPRGLAAVALSPGVVDTDMLRACLPDTAASCDGPGAWSTRAAPFLLGLGPRDNGGSLTCD